MASVSLLLLVFTFGFLHVFATVADPEPKEVYCQRECLTQPFSKRPFDCRFKCKGVHYSSIAENKDCGKWMSWLLGDTCDLIAKRFGLVGGAAELESLNHNLKCDQESDHYLYLPMCVRKVKSGEFSKGIFCDKFLMAFEDETCEDLTKRHPTPIDLAAMNPEVDCGKKLIGGEILCASLYAAPLCDQFHPVVAADETCESIRAKWDLKSIATLTSLNPQLECDKPMEVGRMICVKVFATDLA